jgi:putative salt-induced outer membrane protein YdiY
MRALFLLLALFSLRAFAEEKLTDESQAGVVITNGNSSTQTYNVASKTRYAWDKNAVELNGKYLRGSTSGTVTALNWLVGLRYERELSEVLSLFLGESAEGDQFAGVLQRYNTDAGAKYYFRKLEKDFTWFAEAGYRYTSQHDVTGLTKGYQKARLYSEAEKYWAPTTSTKLWAEYVPNFTVSQQWLLNSEASVSSSLNSVFAVKVAYGWRYNNSPPLASAQKSDTTFSTSLVAKL